MLFWKVAAKKTQAAPILFDNRADFEAATSAAASLMFESFEDDFEAAASVTFGPLTISEMRYEECPPDDECPDDAELVAQSRDVEFDFCATDGTGAAYFHDEYINTGKFTFASPITVFGTDIVTDECSDVTITAASASSGQVVSNNTFETEFSEPRFWGILVDPEDAFTTITFDALFSVFFCWDAVSYGVLESLAPVTSAPVTQSPVTSAPVTQSPVTATPVTPSPTTAAPVVSPTVVPASPPTESPMSAEPTTPTPTTSGAVKLTVATGMAATLFWVTHIFAHW